MTSSATAFVCFSSCYSEDSGACESSEDDTDFVKVNLFSDPLLEGRETWHEGSLAGYSLGFQEQECYSSEKEAPFLEAKMLSIVSLDKVDSEERDL